MKIKFIENENCPILCLSGMKFNENGTLYKSFYRIYENFSWDYSKTSNTLGLESIFSNNFFHIPTIIFFTRNVQISRNWLIDCTLFRSDFQIQYYIEFKILVAICTTILRRETCCWMPEAGDLYRINPRTLVLDHTWYDVILLSWLYICYYPWIN